MTPDDNPFASPLAGDSVVAADDIELSDARRIRQVYLKHEFSVQTIGTLYLLVAVIFALMAGWLIVSGATFVIKDTIGPSELTKGLAAAGIYLGIAALGVYVGWGLKRLNPRVRIVAGVLSALGLIAIPLGTLINGFFLYLLFNRKGRKVFSDEYRDVIRQTPDMRYRASWIVVAVLIGLIALIFGGIAGYVFVFEM